MRYDRNSYPRFIGDGMSKLTGSVAPIDHGLTVTLRVTRKSIMLMSKSTTTNNQSPSCRRRRLPRRPRCPPQLRVLQGRLITSGGRSSTTNTHGGRRIPAGPRRCVGRSRLCLSTDEPSRHRLASAGPRPLRRPMPPAPTRGVGSSSRTWNSPRHHSSATDAAEPTPSNRAPNGYRVKNDAHFWPNPL
jgi:hypothetical protein